MSKHEHPAPAPGGQRPIEDAGTQALSEALSGSFKLVKVIMIMLVVVFLGSGVREVGSHERAVKLNFGKATGSGEEALLGPGWHWAWPYPINEIVKIPIGQVQEVVSTVGFYGRTREQELAGIDPQVRPTLDPVWDGYLLTGDGNIMHSSATLRYRINDAVRYAFNYSSASNVVLNALNNALTYAAATVNVDEAVRRNVTAFKDAVRSHVEATLFEQNLGVSVENLELNSIPPRQVKDAFDAVLGAENQRSKAINDAQSRANAIIAAAAGEAAAIVNRAYGEANQLTNTVAAEARYFQVQLEYYRQNPNLYLSRLQAETFGRMMTNVQLKVVQNEVSDRERKELRLQVNPEPPAPPPGAPEQ
ncbi:MAG TPA: hypothetical protein DCY13_19795 [Verrucomicrobiales bacterium]|nr:hypothetical protein [Verrucomicrobiales bacterium]